MLSPANILGVISALTAALAWGGGDFSGGLATRQSSPFQVLTLSSLSGITVLVAGALLWRETLPSGQDTLWAALAGVVGAVGVAALYRALSLGHAAIVAPTAGVLGAALPVAFATMVHGLPGFGRLAGFGLALLGIWLVSHSSGAETAPPRQGLVLACLAGLGFGGYFILIAQVTPGPVFTPSIVARSVELGIALLMVRVYGLPLPSPARHPVALLAGVLDAGGNVFYLLARQFVRLDVAAVLASLYPAVTVMLATMILRERVSATQGLGLGACLLAIVLITA